MPSPKPLISHDTRALMAALAQNAAYRRAPAEEAVALADTLIAALGYQVMQPSRSEDRDAQDS